MILNLPDDGRPILFVSDVHLGARAGHPDREERLLGLLRGARERAQAVFLLGDLFDFWFEYRHAIPKGTFRIARALAELVEAGVPVAYFGGNHDFWVGSYLESEIGLAVFPEPVIATLQGRRVFLAHGDGLGPGDYGYRYFLKPLLRSRWAIALYRSGLHPDLGIPFARWVSAWSHKHTETREVLLPKVLRDIAAQRLGGDVSAMVMGHIHEPAHFQAGGKDFLLIGDWMDAFTHVRLEAGRFGLYQWTETGELHLSAEPFPPAAAAR
jgi:UDP-2,3-diacylglucosamine hydrolase